MFFGSIHTWLFLATRFCQFGILSANIFGNFGYKVFWNLATLLEPELVVNLAAPVPDLFWDASSTTIC